jgi:hypothetical protein
LHYPPHFARRGNADGGFRRLRAEASEALEKARQHHSARAWALAFDAFRAADRACELCADDLERFATAAYLVGRDETTSRRSSARITPI